jgi:hypothetical protein
MADLHGRPVGNAICITSNAPRWAPESSAGEGLHMQGCG